MLMVVADAYVKGLFDFPLETVYPYMKHEAMIQMPENTTVSVLFRPAPTRPANIHGITGAWLKWQKNWARKMITTTL
jgi:hypothetical protein